MPAKLPPLRNRPDRRDRDVRARGGFGRDDVGTILLEAESLDDLWFAQGFVTAGERLYQMDLALKQANGRLSELFGESVLAMKELWKGTPSTVPRTFTRPRVPKNATDRGNEILRLSRQQASSALPDELKERAAQIAERTVVIEVPGQHERGGVEFLGEGDAELDVADQRRRAPGGGSSAR